MATLTARIDDNIKEEFLLFCDRIGLTASSMINIFAKKCINEQSVPFEINALNYEAKKFKQITDYTNSYYANSKNKPWQSEKEMINELSLERKNRFGY